MSAMRGWEERQKKNLALLGESGETELLGAVKAYLKRAESALKEAHRGARTGVPVCLAYTRVIDDLLTFLYERKRTTTDPETETALVAVGGYGRGELNIHSDIDLVLMHRGQVTPRLKAFTEAFLYLLYDTGLDLGFVMRRPEECISLASGDLKTMTSLLETRYITGSEGLHTELLGLIKKKIFTKKRVTRFIEEKIEETERRYERYGGSVYILEPNVKEGEGGLRDLHTSRWILMARDGVQERPFSMGLISTRDRAALERGLAFLLWIRNELHFDTGRRTDQLTFDQQRRIAHLLGYSDTEGALGVETFMLDYYAHTSDIHNAYELIVSRYEHEKRKKNSLWPARKRRIDADFFVAKGWLTLYEDRPITVETMLRAFEYISREGYDLDQETKDAFISSVQSLEERLPEETPYISEEASRLFFSILASSSPYRVLAAMHSIGLLGIIIPEFRDIRHRAQHDLYHVYTVDAHSLFAVRELERLGEGKYSQELPLLTRLYRSITRKAPLVLATLLHDIGKAHGKGHAENGARLVRTILERLHADRETADLVEFLVRNHLILANTALYRDLHERSLIVRFASTVGDRARLDHLYLLTYADVRAVGPEVWSRWKGVLFEELYEKAGDVIDSGAFEVEDRKEAARKKRAEVAALIKREVSEVTRRRDLLAILDLLPERYYLANSVETIAAHLEIIKAYDGQKTHLLSIEQDPAGAYTSLVICTLDRAGLFAMISGVMAANGIDILGAQITTLKNGIVLDVLQVTDTRGMPVREVFKHKKIEKDLEGVLSGRVNVKKLIRRKPSILEKRPGTPVRTGVNIDNTISDSMTVIDIHAENKLGLLYDITNALSSLGLYINIARISTKGSEATDIFYVKDIFGQKVYGEERMEKIVRTLHESIEGPGEGAREAVKRGKKERGGTRGGSLGR